MTYYEIIPISVWMPVQITIPTPFPELTVVELNKILTLS